MVSNRQSSFFQKVYLIPGFGQKVNAPFQRHTKGLLEVMCTELNSRKASLTAAPECNANPGRDTGPTSHSLQFDDWNIGNCNELFKLELHKLSSSPATAVVYNAYVVLM